VANRAARQPRAPEASVLFDLVRAEWNTFVRRVEAGERTVPRFCVREVEGYLRCGVLGFARVHCDACDKDDVVAFSCKGRGFCPSIVQRVNAATLAELDGWTDRILDAKHLDDVFAVG
jgi:hypothetical protein